MYMLYVYVLYTFILSTNFQVVTECILATDLAKSMPWLSSARITHEVIGSFSFFYFFFLLYFEKFIFILYFIKIKIILFLFIIYIVKDFKGLIN